ncbi:MAG: replicative DNA helicase [Pirellulales bacterium]
MATADRKPRFAPRENLGELLDRQPPQSVEAERAVLGSLLLLPEVCDEVALIIRPDDFYDDANGCIFRHILSLHENGRPVDPQLLSQSLKDAGEFDLAGGAAYLLEVMQAVATAAHAEHFARIVRDKGVLRALIHAGTDIIQESSDPTVDAREMLSRAEERVFRILDTKGDTKTKDVKDIINDCVARIVSRREHSHVQGTVETGFVDFDEKIGGLRNSELVILAARPSMGKTALALNIVEHAALVSSQPTLVVSLEMSSIELGDRLLSAHARVGGSKLRTGHLNSAEQNLIVKAASEYYAAPLFIDDSPSRNMTEIAATARRLKRRENLAMVVIDYLQLIEPDNPRDPRQEQVSKISRRLKGLARELDIPVLCLAQLNRQVEASRDNKPQLSHLRESGAIEQDADIVMFVHREEYYQTNDEDRARVKGEADLLVRKNRNGPTEDIKLTWLHDFTRFENSQHMPYDEFAPFEAETF